MARKSAAPVAAHSPAFVLAQRIHAALEDDPTLNLDPPVEQPGGVVDANALFEIRDGEGRSFRVRVIRTH